MATLRGEPVDRPAVNFYEVGGFKVDPADPDPFNVYNDPSWAPLLDLAERETDLIWMRGPAVTPAADNCMHEFANTENYTDGKSQYNRTTIRVGDKTLTSLTRRDPDVSTIWTIEHLLKGIDDLKAYLELPDSVFSLDIDVGCLHDEEHTIGDRGIVMVEIADPLCLAASLFSMEDYTVVALTEQALFHRLLEKLAPQVYKIAEEVSRGFPGHLWRIAGPEYATPPYLPPRLFDEYVVTYTKPVVDIIHKNGGYARLHCHGRIKDVLPCFAKMGADAIDPIEPPPQGDVTLSYVRREYGKDLVLFGNLEISDLETMEPEKFSRVVAQALVEGTEGEGRGFVLMPSAAPYGRKLSAKVLQNYETMIRLARSMFS